MPNVPNNVLLVGLPNGFNRGDGVDTAYGQASPAGSVTVTSEGLSGASVIPFNEAADSPQIERAEQATCVHRYTCSWSQAKNLIAAYGRGVLISDSYGNYFRVLSSSIKPIKGVSGDGAAELTITSESISFDNPPDEFQITPVKLNLDIMKHPRYFYALTPTSLIPQPWPSWLVADTAAQENAKVVINRVLQAYRENPQIPPANEVSYFNSQTHDAIVNALVQFKFVYSVKNPNFNVIYPASPPDYVGKTYSTNGGLPYPLSASSFSDPNPPFYYAPASTSNDPNNKLFMAVQAAQEIITKLWRCEDSPLINGWEITWSEYYWRPPYLNPGGYIENPVAANPPLPDYFYSPSYPPSQSTTFFDQLSYINPQMYSFDGQYGGGANISCLRDADTMEYNRTWFKVTRKWLCAPIGAWDWMLYNQQNRPKDYKPPTSASDATHYWPIKTGQL